MRTTEPDKTTIFQVVTMLDLQHAMNSKVHAEWRTQGFAWYRAIWVECAELMDHYGWKWWKKQQPDYEQVRLELIDIWHFGLSALMQASPDKDNRELAQWIVSELDQPVGFSDFREALESFTEWTLVNRSFSVRHFSGLMAAADMEFGALYIGYIGKNVLNFFRQDHGYKEGTYIKQWQGREDNEHLVEICAELDTAAHTFQQDVYEGLKKRYRIYIND